MHHYWRPTLGILCVHMLLSIHDSRIQNIRRKSDFKNIFRHLIHKYIKCPILDVLDAVVYNHRVHSIGAFQGSEG